MHSNQLDSLVAIAKDASLLAGKYLLQNYETELKILFNEGRDIKLQIDKDTELLIKDFISSRSDLPILGEETGSSADLQRTFWVIDPLDGTSNYLRGIPISCVSIALMHELKPILGVIYDFNNDHLYYAHSKTSAYMNDSKIHTSKIRSTSEGTLITGIPAKKKYTDDEFIFLVNAFQKWKKVRMIGSAAMASVYVASGKADMYQEDGIFLWDIAAGAAIVKSAGGNIQISNMKKDYRVNAKFTNTQNLY